MSLKDIFDSTKSKRNYLSEEDQKEAFKDVESSRNAAAVGVKHETFVPQVDYHNPNTFSRFGSAYYYYKGAIERILDYYPYDGSEAEKNEFYNNSLDIEKYILDNLYPRTTGYVLISAGGWGTRDGSAVDGYGKPISADTEYISFYGGPGTGSVTSGSTLSLFSPNPYTSKIAQGNIYDENIYQTAGLNPAFGSGSRESNVKSNFDTGVTLEFWLTTGSANTTNITTQTQKQVVFDMWNQNLSSSHDYGRITVALDGNPGASSPFLLTVQSGTSGVFETTVGTGDLDLDSLSSWSHYAIVLYNSGSDLVSRLYVDGTLNEEKGLSVAGGLGELDAKDMQGQLGALITAPSGTAETAGIEPSAMASAGKFSGSLDEFRFWKVKRTGKEIGENWFTQVGGGTNTDISNTTLGVYYKFNEGTTGVSTTDSIVLDYSGRVSNGMWTGYSAGSRNSGSAIVSASAATFEYRDPIVWANNPDVVNLKSDLLDKGNVHDSNNNAAFVNYVPSWIIEEHEDIGNDNLKIISHIMGSYFDKLHLYTSALPQIKTAQYPSASYKPVPFAQHLPQSLGLYTPELFIDATVMEQFANRDANSLFEGDLNETKNLIYTNLYNNLTNIFKAKGTEKALRNVLRCFNIDERLVKINTYANNQTFDLDDNVEQVITQQRVLNLNKSANREAVLYQAQTDSTGETRGYISGTYGAYGAADSLLGMTLEADVIMPRYYSIEAAQFNRNYITSSLFGLATVDTGSSDSLTGVDTGFVADDWANLQVHAIKEAAESKNVYFRLTSSYGPVTLPELTSSVFYNAYDDTQWNFSVRIKPSMYPLVGNLGGNATAYTYDVIFQGTNVIYGEVKNTFTVTGSMAKQDGINLLTAAKRVYVGAQRTNLTGAVLAPSDFYFKSARYWTKYLEDATLARHAQDLDNFGISGSYQNIAPNNQAGFAGAAALANAKYDILNLNTLALNWTFGSTTGSTAQGTLSVQDYSSGSVLLRENYGWLGGITGYQLPASGAFFEASATDTAENKTMNAFRFIEPERATSADAVQILSEDDKVFGVVETVPSYVYTVEKSMYRAISEEMLDFFAGVVDFNNVIGEPINRYRDRYKSLEKLREVFFRRVTQVSDVEKFIDYYKWFDDAMSLIMGQLMPASSDFTNDVYNTIESHVLERNKYQTQYPTLETKTPDPQAAVQGVTALSYDYQFGESTLPSSPRDTTKHVLFWKQRALRTSAELTSGDADVDTQRETYRKVIYSNPTLPEGALVLNDPAASQQYAGQLYARRTFAKIFDMKPVVSSSIKGGINFSQRKQSELLHNSLYPFGPINTTGGRFIPLNVLLSTQDDIIPVTDFADKRELRLRLKRYFKVQRGRDYENGIGYYNLKSDFIYPFNIMSSSVKTGYNKAIIDKVSGGIEITNLHHDTYGPDMETPMQSPFTEYAVGGHQSRHVPLNYSSSTKALDTTADRPEAWKILLGQCPDQGLGALGMAEITYPSPDIGAAPVTASGTITLDGQPAIEDSVTISDGSASVTFVVPFDNEKSVLFDGTGGSDNLIVVGGNFSSSLTSPTQRVWPGYCKDTDPTNYGCSGQPNHYYEPQQTWTAWISQSVDDNGYIFATGVPHGNMVLQTRTSNKIRFTQRWIEPALTHNDVYWETEADAFDSGEWQHVAVVFDASLTGSTSASIYINGLEKAITTYPGSGGGTAPGAGDKLYVAAIQDGTWGTPGVSPGYNCGPLADQPCNSKRNAAVIGGYSNAGVAFTGSIDEMNVWRVSMSAEQISELYATGSVKNLYQHSVYVADNSTLNAWWRMGDNQFDAIDGTDDFSATNRIRDIVSNDYGVPYSSVTGFDTNVVTASTEPGAVEWTLGADFAESLLNLHTAINAQNAAGNLIVSASVPYASGPTEVMPLHNQKYGTPTSSKKLARGSLGNVELYATSSDSVMTLDGMNGGQDPKIMRYQAPRATYYRGLVAKRPVNIRNIRLTSSSPTVLGNYRQNYEVVQTVGAFQTPRSFVETQPTLPAAITTRGNLTSSEVNSSVVVQNYMTLNSNDAWDNESLANHYDFGLDYLVTTNSGAFENDSIIKSQFGAPGSRETSTVGFRDFRSGEFSPYNTLDYRNLSILKPSQGPSGTISGEAPTSVETGIRVYDIHGQDFGLYSHRARHAARFGRDSLQVTGTTAATDGPGASYDQLPAMFKTNRNTLRRLKLTDWATETYTTGSRYDNSNVSHPIPQSDRQYAWITASLVNDNDLYGYLPEDFVLSTSAGYIDAYDFVSSSDVGLVEALTISFGDPQHVYGISQQHYTNFAPALAAEGGWTPVTPGLNNIIYEPLTASSNTLGYPALGATEYNIAAGDYLINYLNPRQWPKWPDNLITDTQYPIIAQNLDPSLSPSFQWIGIASILNSLLMKRGDAYGYPTWRQVRHANHPIIRNENATNRISMVTSSGEVAQYDLFPVSTRGRPISLNLTQQAGGNFTIKSTFNNEKILFTQRQPNDLLGLTSKEVVTPYDQIVDIATTSTQYDLNWVLYSQNIFPSVRNEYQTYARQRTNYENLFWRDGIEARASYGSAIRACRYYIDAGTGYIACNDTAVDLGYFEEGAFETPAQYSQNSYGIPALGQQWYTVSGSTNLEYLAVAGTLAASALSQSSWCLDPPKDFLTRDSTRNANPIWQANIAYGGFNNASSTFFTSGSAWDSVNDARVSGAAGELQNTYGMPLYAVLTSSTAIVNTTNTFKRRCAQASPGALYARKHLLSSPGSCTTPYGPSVWALDTGSNALDRVLNTRFRAFAPKQVWVGGGEALWEAGENAGYFIKTGSASGKTTFEWVSHSSEPWFNSYDDFKFDLMNIAKDYVIIPEYRMSEHVDDYAKYGLLNPEKSDSLSIPGTTISSSQGNFYRDYTNSEFLKEVLNIKRETLLNAKEIQLVCSAAIRYNPYEGFYPAQRTLELVSQFSRSYSQNLQTTNYANDSFMNGISRGEDPLGGYGMDWALYNYGGQFRPCIAPLFAPGILYNSIKSGLAVDYPVVTDGTKLAFQFTSGSALDGTGGGIMFGGVGGPDYTSENWLLNVNSGALMQNPYDATGAVDSKPYFDTRLPFETILRPEEFMLGINMIDLEPHWSSASLAQTGALAAGPSDNLYTLMAQNFFGEVGNFFLNNAGFTKLESKPVPDKLTFKSGSAYGARIRLRRSHNGNRYYNFESSSWVGQVFDLSGGLEPLPTLANGTAMNPENFGYALEGAQAIDWSAGTVDSFHLVAISASVSASDYYELPQDPANNPSFKETFTMYSRPTAFGPPLSGRGILNSSHGFMTGANSERDFELRYSPLDGLNGFNWAYTPGYYHGEAWFDIVFYPSASREYTVEEILNEAYTVSRRYDNGSSNVLRNTASIADITAWGGSFSSPYGGSQIDQHAMQIDASINCLGVEKVQFTETDKFNLPATQRNVVAGTKWVIQPKFETPMANFSDMGTRPLTASNDTMTLPLVASQSAARGMWHQFGTLEPDPNKGIFLEIGDIPANWLKNHYSTASGSATAYNNYDANVVGYDLANNMQSLVDLFGFEKTETSSRLGELADSQTIREAVVAIPYITEEISLGLSTTQQDSLYNEGAYRQGRKKFITIPKERLEAAKKEEIGSQKGDSFIAAGASIRKQLQKMERYILPPEFDFLTNPQIDPFVMYMFEFEYTFDKDDLNYIWQNIAPRNYKKMELQAQSVAHELMDTELLTEANLTASQALRWMVFKVKQKSEVTYQDLVVAQAAQASNQRFLSDPNKQSKVNYQYNWPYDYLSFVEMVKIDAQVLFTDDEPPTLISQTDSGGVATAKVVREKKPFSKKKKVGGKGGITRNKIQERSKVRRQLSNRATKAQARPATQQTRGPGRQPTQNQNTKTQSSRQQRSGQTRTRIPMSRRRRGGGGSGGRGGGGGGKGY